MDNASKFIIAVSAAGALSFLPIWRAAGVEEGLSLWQYLSYTSKDIYRNIHIPSDLAVKEAQEIYYEKHR